MVERTVDVLDEVGVCPRNDQHYRTIKLNELSPDLLGRYKKRAAAQSSALAKAGDHKKSHKRYKGVNTATTLQFRNDVKKHDAREKRKKRNLTVIDKNTGEPSFFSRALRGYGTTNRDKDGRVISRPINPDYWKEPEDPITRYKKGLEKQKKKREDDAYKKNIDYDTAKHADKIRYRGYDVRRKEVKPSKTTGEKDDYEKEKEKQRKDVKQRHPNVPLKWSNKKWVANRKIREDWGVRASDVLQIKEKIKIKYQLNRLDEISIRTGAITLWLATVKKWATTVDSLAGSMKSKASTLDTADTPEKRNKIEKELWTIDSEITKALRKMIIYGSLISAAGGLGADRAYKEIKKQISKRRK